MLEIHLPIGIDAWEEITRLHVETYPLSGRTVESLRRKYNALAKKKAGTGDPHIPKPVLQAKAIQKLIIQRSEASTIDETDEGEGRNLPSMPTPVGSLNRAASGSFMPTSTTAVRQTQFFFLVCRATFIPLGFFDERPSHAPGGRTPTPTRT